MAGCFSPAGNQKLQEVAALDDDCGVLILSSGAKLQLSCLAEWIAT